MTTTSTTKLSFLLASVEPALLRSSLLHFSRGHELELVDLLERGVQNDSEMAERGKGVKRKREEKKGIEGDDQDNKGSTRKRAKGDPPPLQDKEVSFAEGVTVWVSERGGPLCVLGQWKDCSAGYATIERRPSLNVACLNGHLSAASLLIKHGADACGTEGDEQFFPLYIACRKGHQEIAAMLLDRGADVNQAKNNGTSSLFIACQEGYKEIAAMLLDRGADVNQARGRDTSSLYVACQNGHKEIASVLLDRGADVNQARNDGASNLYIACEVGHTEIAAMLLDRGADVNQANNDELTSLFIACQKGHQDIAAMLLDRGADIHQAADGGRTPLRVACDKQRVEIAAMLLERGADDDGSHYAAEDNKRVLTTWKAARARLANDMKIADALQRDPLDGDGLLSPYVPPPVLASIVQAYVFSSHGIDRADLLASQE